MRRPTRLTLALLLSLSLLSPAAAGGDADEDAALEAWDAVQRSAIGDFAELAERCHESKRFQDRNQAYELLLRLDPDHARARKRLRYEKDDEGRWARPGVYKPPRNLKRAGDALLERQERVAATFADAVIALLDAHGDALPADVRARALWTAALAAPQRADVRTRNGEVKTQEGTWILAESERAPARRAALEECAENGIRGAAAPRKTRLSAVEKAVDLPWSAVLKNPRVRVLGTPPVSELEEAASLATATYSLFTGAFGRKAPTIEDYTIYVLRSVAEQKTFLRQHPGASDKYRAWAERLASSWIPKTRHVFVRSTRKERRMEWCARQTIWRLMSLAFETSSKNGWAMEGFGLYLDHLVSGQRQTFFVRRTQYEDQGASRRTDLWDALKKDGSDWREEARTMLAGDSKPDLALLLGKTVNTMNTEDLLCAYVLAAYCLEGRAAEAPRLLDALGRGKEPPAKALREVLGLDVHALEERVIRWLEETK